MLGIQRLSDGRLPDLTVMRRRYSALSVHTQNKENKNINPDAKIKAANWHILRQNGGCYLACLYFINQRNEPHHEKEHVKISTTAKFQSFWPNTQGMRDKIMYESRSTQALL